MKPPHTNKALRLRIGGSPVHPPLDYAAGGLTGWHLLQRRAKPQDHRRIDPRVSAGILGLVAVSGHLGGELASNKGVRAEQSQPLT